MKLAEAKDLILSLILAGQPEAARSLGVSSASPDGDPGKFLIDGKAARAIHRYNGWLVPISLGWFSGGYDLPVIHQTRFYSARHHPCWSEARGGGWAHLR